MTNQNGGQLYMYVGQQYQNQIFYDYLENVNETVTIDDKGYGLFTVQDGSVSVYIPKKIKWSSDDHH